MPFGKITLFFREYFTVPNREEMRKEILRVLFLERKPMTGVQIQKAIKYKLWSYGPGIASSYLWEMVEDGLLTRREDSYGDLAYRAGVPRYYYELTTYGQVQASAKST